MSFSRVIVTGGRGFTGIERIRSTFAALHGGRPEPFRVAHGGNGIRKPRPWTSSADALAQRVVEEAQAWYPYSLGSVECSIYEVDTRVDGPWPAAGNRRNERMLHAEIAAATAAGELDRLLVLACPDPESRGTWNCVREAVRLELPVVIWTGALTNAYAAADQLRLAVAHRGRVTANWILLMPQHSDPAGDSDIWQAIGVLP